MARRRVNTAFVVTLAVSVSAAGALVVGLRVLRWWKNHDPATLETRGAAAEKSGDLKEAVREYSAAADETAKRKKLGADDLFVHAALLAMRVSQSASTEDDAVNYYEAAKSAYAAASQQNPQNAIANDALLDLQYERAATLAGPADAIWQMVADTATKLIQAQPAAKPLAYRAKARLYKLESKPEGYLEDDLKDAQDDVNAALKLNPTYGLAVSLQGRIMVDRASVRRKQNGVTAGAFAALRALGWDWETHVSPAAGTAPASGAPGASVRPGASPPSSQPSASGSDLANAESYMRDMDAARDYLQAYLQKNALDSDVAAELADIWAEDFDLFGTNDKTGQSAFDRSLDLLERSLAKDPRMALRGYGLALNQRYAHSKDLQARGEKFYQQLTKQYPDGPEAYYLLAEFYRTSNRPADAAAAYKQSAQHAQIGSGLQAELNQYYQGIATERIAEADMDQVQALPDGMTSDHAKALMKEASDYTEKLRSSHAQAGIVALLDGRAQLIAGNIPQAMQTLQQADGFLATAEGASDRLVESKKLRAQANEEQKQYGAALGLINDALKIAPGDVGLLENRARLCMITGQYPEARAAAQAVLGPQNVQSGVFDGSFAGEEKLPASLRQTVLEIWASATVQLGGVNDSRDARVVFDRIGENAEGPDAILDLANRELNSGEFQGAAADAARVISTAASNTRDQNIQAYQMAITAQALLGDRAKAQDLAREAAAKYPDDPSLQLRVAAVTSTDGNVSIDTQLKIAELVKDPYSRAVQIASVYHIARQPDQEIKSLQAAESIAETGKTDADHDHESSLVDGIFNAATSAAAEAQAESSAASAQAGAATSDADRTKFTALAKKQGDLAIAYFDTAQTYAQKAEKVDLDGVGGKLYRGRLQFVKSLGKNGVDLIAQAVAQRPDYALGHLMLGEAYLDQKNTGAALDEFRQVIRLAPTNLAAIQYALQILVPHGNVAEVNGGALKEAQDLVTSGLRIAPNNTVFQDYADVLLTGDADIETAINRREKIYASAPDDLDNLESLAVLYQRWQLRHPAPAPETPGAAPATQPDNKALDLMQAAMAKHPDNIGLADLSAQIMARSGHADQALKEFDSFAASADQTVKYEALIDKAQICKLLGRVDDAAATLNDAIKIQPAGVDQAQRVLGDMYYETGRLADAANVYRELAKGIRDPDARDRVIRRMIDSELQSGNYSDADSALATMDQRLEALYKTNPDYKRDYVELLLLQGFSQMEQKNLSKSMDIFNRVLTIDPGNATALYYRADAQWTLGDKPKVKDAVISDLIQSRSADKSIQSRLLLAKIYSDTQSYGEAAIMFEEAITMRPDLANIRVDYAQYLLKLLDRERSFASDANPTFAGSIKELDPATRLYKQLKDAEDHFPDQDHMLQWWLMYGELLTLQGDDTNALHVYSALYTLRQNNVQVCDAYLAALLKSKDFASAITVASKLINDNQALIQSHPELVVFYLKRAAAYSGQNQQDLATADVDHAFGLAAAGAAANHDYLPYLTVLNQASQILPNDLLADRLKARIAANPGETISQVALMQVLLTMDRNSDAADVANSVKPPAGDTTLQALALRESATALYMAKKYTAAEQDFSELVKVAPNDVDGLNNFAFMLADGMNKPKDGILYAQRALQVLATHSDPDNIMTTSATVYDTLGWAEYLDGQLDTAINTLRNSLSWQKMPATYLHLATAYKKDKQLVEAQIATDQGLGLATLYHDQTSLPGLQKIQVELKDLQKAAGGGQ